MVFEKVATMIAEQFDVDEGEITPETTFEDIGADEVDINDLVIALEGEFDIEIDRNEINDINSVSQLVDIIDKETTGMDNTFD